MVYTVCDTCAPVLANGDMSAIGASDMPIVVDNIAQLGLVALTGEYVTGGYWMCDVCDWEQIGNGHTFERV